MKRTLLQVRAQLEELRKEEERLKQAEAAEVIEKIKVAIEAYGFVPADLFGTKSAGIATAPSASAGPGPKRNAKSKSKISAKAQYADGMGQEWVGRGPRPLWLREALANGRSLSEFTIGKPAQKKGVQGTDASSKTEEAAGQPKKKAVAIKYRDGVNTWTGRGSMPKWLKAAVETGKSADAFLA